MSNPENGLRRRDVLIGAGALGALALGASAHAHPNPSPGPRGALVEAANDCLAHGEICLSHCLAKYREGDTTLAACASSVDAMLPVCRALAALAVRDSKHLAAQARACIAVCEDCERECRKHAGHHAECKAAAEACAALVAEAKKVVA